MNTNYAGFFQRLVALVIDAIIIGIVQSFVIVPILAAIGFGFFNAMENSDMSDPDNAAGFIGAIMATMGTIWILTTALWVIYFTLMESSKMQATVGKMAMGIIVTDINGAKLDVGKSFVRNLCRLLSNFTLCIGYIIAAFTDKKQALHDIIAGTLVVKKPATAPA